jgi:hypothetical protein
LYAPLFVPSAAFFRDWTGMDAAQTSLDSAISRHVP